MKSTYYEAIRAWQTEPEQFKNSNHQSPLTASTVTHPTFKRGRMVKHISGLSHHEVGHVTLFEEPAVVRMHFLSDEDIQL